MSAYFLTSLDLALRWAHVVLSMTWIGASFYFMWLNSG